MDTVALTVIGAILLVITALLFSPIHIRITYGEDGIKAVFSCLGVIRKRLYPLPKRKKRTKTRRKSKAEPKTGAKDKKSPFGTLRELRSLIAALLERMPKTFTLRIRRFILLIGSDDAAKTALLYGTASTSLSVFMEWLDRHLLTIRRPPDAPFIVNADFSAGEIICEADLVLTTTLLRLIRIACAALLPHFLKRRIRRKKSGRSKKS